MLTSHCKETKQPHKKFKVDLFGGIYTDIPPHRYAPGLNLLSVGIC